MDHAGGAATLVAEFEIGEILSGEPLPALGSGRNGTAGILHPGDTLEWISQCCIPGPGDFRTGNNASCVVLIAAGERRAMLTGDIEARIERELVETGIVGPVEWVTAPHHGSKTSSSPAFVARLDADYAIVSAGFGNRWGFPDVDVRATLEQRRGEGADDSRIRCNRASAVR